MASSSSSPELTCPKIECDIDAEIAKRVLWTPENTVKLIKVFEHDCPELWDTKNPLNKDRTTRQAKLEYLANVFWTSAEEISRKLHNLRTQFNNELRKIKKRTGGEPTAPGSSGWEYFEILLFLLREPIVDNSESMDAVNLALAAFQADEELKYESAAFARLTGIQPKTSPKLIKPKGKVSASAPNPLPASANPMLWPDEPLLVPTNNNPDECQIFGDFVASELRTLRSYENRARLKRIIQKAILQVAEEEDIKRAMQRRVTSESPDPLD